MMIDICSSIREGTPRTHLHHSRLHLPRQLQKELQQIPINRAAAQWVVVRMAVHLQWHGTADQRGNMPIVRVAVHLHGLERWIREEGEEEEEVLALKVSPSSSRSSSSPYIKQV